MYRESDIEYKFWIRVCYTAICFVISFFYDALLKKRAIQRFFFRRKKLIIIKKGMTSITKNKVIRLGKNAFF